MPRGISFSRQIAHFSVIDYDTPYNSELILWHPVNAASLRWPIVCPPHVSWVLKPYVGEIDVIHLSLGHIVRSSESLNTVEYC
jgi:hypothetical protein